MNNLTVLSWSHHDLMMHEYENIFCYSIHILCTWQNMLMCTLILHSVHRWLISAECECLIVFLHVTCHSCVWRAGIKTTNVAALTWFSWLQNEKQARMPCTIFLDWLPCFHTSKCLQSVREHRQVFSEGRAHVYQVPTTWQPQNASKL